ncbi:acyl-CoA dehydrogenase family protein [Streptomyces spinosirectus]
MSDLPTEPDPLSDQQRDIVEPTGAFAREEMRPRARGVDEADARTSWDHLWREAAEPGITGLMPPEGRDTEPEEIPEEIEEGTSDTMRLVTARSL